MPDKLIKPKIKPYKYRKPYYESEVKRLDKMIEDVETKGDYFDGEFVPMFPETSQKYVTDILKKKKQGYIDVMVRNKDDE